MRDPRGAEDQGSPSSGRWRSVVCIASGPSLTADQIEKVKRWREEEAQEARGVIVTNTSFRVAPWADALFAMDRAWWGMYLTEVQQTFSGELYSISAGAKGPQRIPKAKLGHHGNSGAGAILLAQYFGAERIILLGYDCHKRGKSHHHGDHPKGLGNAGSILKWPKQFQEVARRLRAQVFNCSPGTALDVFRKVDLDTALNAE